VGSRHHYVSGDSKHHAMLFETTSTTALTRSTIKRSVSTPGERHDHASRNRPYNRSGPFSVGVDIMAGQGVATRYARNLAVTQRVVGNDELVHQQIARWLRELHLQHLGPSTNNLIGQRFQHIPGVFTDSVRYNVGRRGCRVRHHGM
jgi:hypothetical protein